MVIKSTQLENLKGIVRVWIEIDSEVTNVKNQLSELTSKISDDVIKIKINETVKQLDNVNKFNLVKDNQVMVLLLSYELIKEIKNQL
jgi:hypothetical protein